MALSGCGCTCGTGSIRLQLAMLLAASSAASRRRWMSNWNHATSQIAPSTAMSICPPRILAKLSADEKQLDVARDIASQIAGGSHSVFGVMIESHINAGAQKFTPGKDDASALEYGKSITDACLGWDDSLVALAELSAAVQARRSR